MTGNTIITEYGVEREFIYDSDAKTLTFTATGEVYKNVTGLITLDDVYGAYYHYEYVDREDADLVIHRLCIDYETYSKSATACLTFDRAYEQYWSDRPKDEVLNEKLNSYLVFDYNGVYYAVGYGETANGVIKELTTTRMLTDETVANEYQIHWDGIRMSVTDPRGTVYYWQSIGIA